MYKFENLYRKRRSIRKYIPKKIPRNLILKCIEASRFAPSAENIQPWRFIVVDDVLLLEKIKGEVFTGIFSATSWIKTAPVIIVVLLKQNFVVHKLAPFLQKVDYSLIDIGIATEHLILQATEFGLGSCWVGWFNKEKIRKILHIPKKYKIVALISLGYPDKKYKPTKRKIKKLKEIVKFNQTFE
jgi:nitroreductase